MREKCVAIVLAGGQGKRMNSSVPKQYMMILEKPILYYTLKTFEDSFIDEIIIVTPEGGEDYCQKEIVERYEFHKVTKIVSGGKERYHSVYNGIKAIGDCDYIFVHDGARAFLTEDILTRCLTDVREYGACVASMPVKDTIKISDGNGFVDHTPDRSLLYMVQTPQVFDAPILRDAYSKLIKEEQKLIQEGIHITDDTMVVEYFMNHQIKLTEGSYTNIKVTTPDDLILGEAFLKMPHIS